jgi:hypothetical protein
MSPPGKSQRAREMPVSVALGSRAPEPAQGAKRGRKGSPENCLHVICLFVTP